MAQDSHAPATKQDVSLIMDELGKLYDANEGWKNDIIHTFQIIAEDLRHDAFGIQKDRMEDHERRIVRLERQRA